MGRSGDVYGKDVTDMGHDAKEKQTLKCETDHRELKKHAAAIHCSNTMSLLQRKISNALLYHAYQELMLKEEHEITVKQLCKLISYQGNNHAVIKDAFKELLSTVIEWNLTNDKTGMEDWTASSILASVSLQGPMCYYSYSPRMKQLLHSPSMFGRIDLFIQSQFRSSYGLALYENCIRYRGLPYTKWVEIETFRKLMGVPANKYSIFRDFKKRVLDKSVEEVNTYSDLVVATELQREGTRVVKVRFSLKERTKKMRLGSVKKELQQLPEPQLELRKRLVEDYGFSKEQAAHVLKEYPPEIILEKMLLIEGSKNFQQGKVQNLPAYLMSALRFNYQNSGLIEKKYDSVKVEEGRDLDDIESKRKLDHIRKSYDSYRIQLIDQALENLSETDKQAFMVRFYEYARVAINTVLHLQRRKYTQETVLSSPQIKAILRQFIQQEMIQQELISFDEYVEKLSKQ